MIFILRQYGDMGNGVGFNVGMHVRNSRRKNGNQERRNEHTDEGGGQS